MRRQAIDWERIFAKYLSDKGLTARIYKDHLQLNKEINNLIKKWKKDINRHGEEGIQTASKHMKRCSTSLIIRKMQIETIM